MPHTAPAPGSLRPVVIVALVTALCLAGDSMLYIALPIYWHEVGLEALWQVGVLLSINRLIRLPFNPLIGRLYKHLALKTGLLLAVVIGVLSTAGYGLASGFLAWGLLRGLWGIGWSFFRIGGLSAVVYCAADHQRGRAMGLYNGLYRLGSLVGMLLGLPLLAKGFDLPESPAGHARTSAATAATSVARRPPPRGLVILSGFATALLIQGVLAATLSALIARSFGTEVSLLGLALSAAGLSGIIQALRWSWEPWLAGRFGAWSDGPRGRRRFYVAALLVGAMGFGLLSSRLPILAWLAIALLVMLVATALTTLTDALAADVARAGDVVGFMTRYSIVQDLGAALGPALAFLLLERPGGFAWLYWGGSLAFLVLALLWLRRADSQTGLLTIR
ncbi:MFS transporter [Pseudomonas aeruginosa]|uniref:MFS transporter n=1 Tax=Pseudomonas aeruginosa TaxID=287 RepID=UPI000F61CB08|nr:MFS transporter [Pseudomonas aeruginosa]RRI57910.1 MFS transporter [Pseudomonas aeruginosa]RRI70636.1 MFS transporter [Pseudomonas aeruginosa]